MGRVRRVRRVIGTGSMECAIDTASLRRPLAAHYGTEPGRLHGRVRHGALALVIESGCGKSMAALAAMGLLPEGMRRSARSIRLAGPEVADAPPPVVQSLCGRAMSMIFQEPMTALNPVFTATEQIAGICAGTKACPAAKPGTPRPRRRRWL